MFKRRLLLRLAVAFITFIIGLAAASLFGASRPAGLFSSPPRTRVVFVPYNAPRDLDSSPPCGSFRMRHAFERDAWHARTFGFDAPAPPQPGNSGR